MLTPPSYATPPFPQRHTHMDTMQELPASISGVGSSAKVLDAKNNRLKALPPSLASLEGLQRLNLANNQLDRLDYVTSLHNLKATPSHYNFSPTFLYL